MSISERAAVRIASCTESMQLCFREYKKYDEKFKRIEFIYANKELTVDEVNRVNEELERLHSLRKKWWYKYLDYCQLLRSLTDPNNL